VLLNADVRLPDDFLARARELLGMYGRAMITAATVDRGTFVSSGCRMVSWPLALTRHVLVGPYRPVSPTLISVDMLAGRALCFPARALREVGLMAARQLPHYGADYEYTARARRRGYRLYVVPTLQVSNDSTHTGLKSTRVDTTLAMRLKGLAAVKSTSNLRHRTRLVLLTYPWYSIPTGLVLNWIKLALEVGLGERVYRAFTLRGT
jgi:GT2 family glycosyltransferase